MCVNPRVLNNGVMVSCRKCWQCKANYVNDWVGRCIAESMDCTHAHSVTLTYGRDSAGNVDHERAAILTYSDVQKAIKRFRRDGFPLRYFAVGEFGSAKGRAHWHAIFFWKTTPPPITLGERIHLPQWPHGYSHFEEVNAASIRYVCKYIQKDDGDTERQRQVCMSKYPPLGAAYFTKLAKRYVKQGLAPRVPDYHFKDVLDRHGETIKFRLQGRSLDIFLQAFCEEWEAKRGGHPPASDLLQEYYDRVAVRPDIIRPRGFVPSGGKPWITPPGPMEFSEPHNTWKCVADGLTLFWSYDDRGKRAWQSVIRTERQADHLREAFERRQTSEKYREASRGI